AATPATPPLALTVILRVGPHLEKIDVALRALWAAHRVVVGRTRVVRHYVSGLQLELLEHQRVAGGEVANCARAVMQRHSALRSSVHRVNEVELGHAVIVL